MATEIDLRKLLSSVFLSWFTPVLSTGNQKKLELSDIPLLPQQLRTNSSKKKFVERRSTEEQNGYLTDCWMRCSDSDYTKKLRKSRSTLLRRILTVQGSALFKTGVLKLLMTALSFAGPVLLGNIVSFIEQKPTINEYPEALLWISLLAISSAASAALNTNYNLRSWAIKASVQGSLTRVVFERAMRLPLIACQDLEMTDAQVNNLVQVDVEQLANCFTSIHDLWSLPLQIVVAFVLLYLQIRIAFIAGVVVIVLLIPVNTVIAKRIGSATDKLMKEKDNRLKVISEALRSICSCKMSGLEQFVLNLSKYYRDRELSHLATRKYLDALCVLLWATTPVLVPYITFTAAVLLPDQAELSSADIISAIALLNMLIFPMNAFPWVVNGIMEARVSLQRISKALCNRRGDSLVTINEELNVIGNISGSKANRSFTVKNVEFGWKNTLNEDSSQLLDGTSSPLIKDDAENFSVRIAENGLDFKSGEVMAIVGATGAGKSTLLLGLLRETRHQCHGLEQSLHMDLLEFSHFFGSFCPQIPPLLTGSIRSNVIMDRDMEVHKYADIIRGCCLVQDISEVNCNFIY